MHKQKNRRGRPPGKLPPRKEVHLRVSPELIAALDARAGLYTSRSAVAVAAVAAHAADAPLVEGAVGTERIGVHLPLELLAIVQRRAKRDAVSEGAIVRAAIAKSLAESKR